MSRGLPERPVNVAVLMREAFVVLNDLVLTRLAERAGVSKQAMASLVSHLEEHGYLVRVPDPSDGRAKLVLATERGREVLAIAQATVPEVETRVADVIGERRLQEMRKDLESIVTAAW